MKMIISIDVKLLPFNIVYAVEDPDEKISLFNDILLECMNRHAPLKRNKNYSSSSSMDERHFHTTVKTETRPS